MKVGFGSKAKKKKQQKKNKQQKKQQPDADGDAAMREAAVAAPASTPEPQGPALAATPAAADVAGTSAKERHRSKMELKKALKVGSVPMHMAWQLS